VTCTAAVVAGQELDLSGVPSPDKGDSQACLDGSEQAGVDQSAS
jgi:hypothetical protein